MATADRSSSSDLDHCRKSSLGGGTPSTWPARLEHARQGLHERWSRDYEIRHDLCPRDSARHQCPGHRLLAEAPPVGRGGASSALSGVWRRQSRARAAARSAEPRTTSAPGTWFAGARRAAGHSDHPCAALLVPLWRCHAGRPGRRAGSSPLCGPRAGGGAGATRSLSTSCEAHPRVHDRTASHGGLAFASALVPAGSRQGAVPGRPSGTGALESSTRCRARGDDAGRVGAAEPCQAPSRVPGLRGGEPSRCSRSSCRLGGCWPPPTRSESSATARNHEGHWNARVVGSSLRLTPQLHGPISSPPLTLLLASSPCGGANTPWRTPGTARRSCLRLDLRALRLSGGRHHLHQISCAHSYQTARSVTPSLRPSA